jgi:hypothetical protein
MDTSEKQDETLKFKTTNSERRLEFSAGWQFLQNFTDVQDTTYSLFGVEIINQK